MDDDDDDDMDDAILPVRPYCADSVAGSSQAARDRKVFTPKPPSERHVVQQSTLSWAPQETATSVLQGALRRQQDANYTGAGAQFIPQRFQGMTLNKFGIDTAKLGSGGPGAFVSGVPGMPAPRQTKQYGEGKSLDLADLAFTPNRRMADGSIRTNYTPISLPYFNVADDDEPPSVAASSSGGGPTSKKGRPTLHHVDEHNSNAAREIFLDSAGDLKEDDFLLIQLPAVLPELADPLEEEQRVGEDAATAGAGASITRLPDGLLGKLKIHKSGKVRMEIGGLPFRVDQGCDTFFQQELACVCPLAKEMVCLGPIRNRVVVTPEIDAMLAQLGKAPATSSGALGGAVDGDVRGAAVAAASAPPAGASSTAAVAAAPKGGGAASAGTVAK